VIGYAFAKLNLGLEVLFRREDGYHELRTIFQTVDLTDRLHFEATSSGIELATDDSSLATDRENLVVKAAELLRDQARVEAGARIVLEKQIPPGKGLGGGSADAAITLLALNRLWGLDVSSRTLTALAREIGADVPYFLLGGTALGLGRGDEVYPLAPELDFPILLILPDFSLETAAVYRNLELTRRESSTTLVHFVSSVLDGRGDFLFVSNDLESAAMKAFPPIERFKRDLLELGASAASLTGSGSAVFGVFKDLAMAHSATRFLASRGVRAIVTRTISRKEYLERRLVVGVQHTGDP
jgi:4-diphosphocytidyl-2-C-methyl-D-erythritol kinase